MIYEELKERLVDAAANISLKEDICEIKSRNVEKIASDLYNYFYDSMGCFYRYEDVVFDCMATHQSKLQYSNLLLAYKRRDFDERNETLLLRQSKEKTFRFLLNEYIVGFKPRQLSLQKNLYFDITRQGKFIAIKKVGYKSINYDLSASERMLFDFLCFIEINKFRQLVNGVKDFNHNEKPLILVNFPEYLDEKFDYISFLRKQKLNRKIIIIVDIICTENVASVVV